MSVRSTLSGCWASFSNRIQRVARSIGQCFRCCRSCRNTTERPRTNSTSSRVSVTDNSSASSNAQSTQSLRSDSFTSTKSAPAVLMSDDRQVPGGSSAPDYSYSPNGRPPPKPPRMSETLRKVYSALDRAHARDRKKGND